MYDEILLVVVESNNWHSGNKSMARRNQVVGGTVSNAERTQWVTLSFAETKVWDTHTRLMALFQDYPGKPIPER